MSLQSGGACTIPNKAADSRELALEGQGTNYIGDIQGARPTEKMNRFTDKPNFYNVNDIKGTRPLTLHRAINAVDYTLKCDDIEGSRPRGQSHKAARSNNPIDPLMPGAEREAPRAKLDARSARAKMSDARTHTPTHPPTHPPISREEVQ